MIFALISRFFFNVSATTEIYTYGHTLSLHDALPICCIFADGAFLWSDLPQIIHLDRHDRINLEIGAHEGLNEGITVPYFHLGSRMGSCTFAGTTKPEQAHRFIGRSEERRVGKECVRTCRSRCTP